MKLTNLSDIVLQVLGEVLIFTMLYYGTNLYPDPTSIVRYHTMMVCQKFHYLMHFIIH